jgi:hypothetical protein
LLGFGGGILRFGEVLPCGFELVLKEWTILHPRTLQILLSLFDLGLMEGYELVWF